MAFNVVLHKQQLTFSAAHFITFGDDICERLHGHNYGVRCEVVGSLNDHGYVVDFIALRDELARVCSRLDHRMLLPTAHPKIRIERSEAETTATYEDRRWVFPADDCVLLPITNTTAELLADWIAKQLLEQAASWSTSGVTTLLVGVDENNGQWGQVEIELDKN